MNPLLKITRKAEHALKLINTSLSRKGDPQYLAIENWYKDDPHSLRRSTFDYLNESSVVFDLGGYEGQWTSDIYSRYRCQVYVFEPVKSYFDIITSRFKSNPDIHIFQFGLGAADQQLEIGVNEFASSVIQKKKDSKTELISIRELETFTKEQQLKVIDLMKVNIEGSEFELFEHLLRSGLISSVRGILIQFHNFVPDAIARRNAIREGFRATHHCVFSYDFVWEYWQLKE